jgi:hypothetical protein
MMKQHEHNKKTDIKSYASNEYAVVLTDESNIVLGEIVTEITTRNSEGKDT